MINKINVKQKQFECFRRYDCLRFTQSVHSISQSLRVGPNEWTTRQSSDGIACLHSQMAFTVIRLALTWIGLSARLEMGMGCDHSSNTNKAVLKLQESYCSARTG